MTVGGRTRPALAALVALLSALLLGIGVMPVLADTEVGHSGLAGTNHLRDRYVDASHYQAGAQCVYDDGGGFHAMDVRPPFVLARSTTSAEDFRVVGWRARFQRRQPDGSWTTLRTSSVERATASDVSSAGFSKISFESGNPDGFDAGRYRALADLYWYSADATESVGTGTVIGQVTRRADVYQLRTIGIGPGGDSFSARLGNCRE